MPANGRANMAVEDIKKKVAPWNPFTVSRLIIVNSNDFFVEVIDQFLFNYLWKDRLN
ncbi:hypothetical protein [Paraflavitalea speifideaquila]|uniref:hypothetical protein n=1 Tax=Paraflavitalea speifideaquila TaxID=3076558 RepID=UPI0028F01FBF|nr:hypothetical protein [Paraflavitalea speifideiaquila]